VTRLSPAARVFEQISRVPPSPDPWGAESQIVGRELQGRASIPVSRAVTNSTRSPVSKTTLPECSKTEFVVAAGCQCSAGATPKHFVAGAHGVAARRFPLQNLGRPPIHRRRLTVISGEMSNSTPSHRELEWPHFHAQWWPSNRDRADGGFDAVIGKRQIGRARRGLVRNRSRLGSWSRHPGTAGCRRLVIWPAVMDSARRGSYTTSKAPEIRTVEHEAKNTLVVCRAIDAIQHQPGLIAGAQVVQHGRELFVQQGADSGVRRLADWREAAPESLLSAAR